MTVKPVDNFVYQVKDGHKDHVVNLNDRTCTYCRFDLDLFSFAYACVAIKYIY